MFVFVSLRLMINGLSKRDFGGVFLRCVIIVGLGRVLVRGRGEGGVFG